MTAVVDTVALAHLVAVIERCRPDWDPPGIRPALEQALSRHSFPTVALIAVATARDATARTPAAITFRCDQGWRGNDETLPPTHTPPNTRDMRCPKCNAWLIGGEAHNCRDRASPEHAAAANAAAKASLQRRINP